MLAGLMQNVPLTLNLIRERVADLYPNKTVTTRYPHAIHVISYGEVLDRAGRIANFLQDIGITRGERENLLGQEWRWRSLRLPVPRGSHAARGNFQR